MSVAERRARFRVLHEGDELFAMPNPWDVGSAKLLERAGFEALATTSAGFAWSLGKLDQRVTRDELVDHVTNLADAVSVPLNVDSERCYRTIRAASPRPFGCSARQGQRAARSRTTTRQRADR